MTSLMPSLLRYVGRAHSLGSTRSRSTGSPRAAFSGGLLMSTSGQWRESRRVPLGAARYASVQGVAHCRHHRCSEALHTLTSARVWLRRSDSHSCGEIEG